jgi:hypothetical protein
MCMCMCINTNTFAQVSKLFFCSVLGNSRLSVRSGDGFTVAVAVASGLLDLDSLLLKVSLTFGDISFWTDLVWATIDLVWTLTTPC